MIEIIASAALYYLACLVFEQRPRSTPTFIWAVISALVGIVVPLFVAACVTTSLSGR